MNQKHFDQERDEWERGSKCQVYSKSRRKWFDGNIVNIFTDKQGEWLKVTYTADNVSKKKEVQRYSEIIRPICSIPNMKYKAKSKSSYFGNSKKKPHLRKRKTTPLSAIHEQKQYSISDRSTDQYIGNNSPSNFSLYKLKSLQSQSNHNVMSISSPIKSPETIGDNKINTNEFVFVDNDFLRNSEVVEWRKDDDCQTFIRSKGKWVNAKVVQVFEHNNEEWLQLKCYLNKNNAEIFIELPSTDENIRNISLLSTISVLENKFDESGTDSLLSQVIDSVNDEIDSSHNFLYQVYHINNDIQKFITYEHDKAMEHFKTIIKTKYSTSMLCNGRILKEYGLSDYYTISTAHAKSDYDTISSALHNEKLDKQEIIKNWKENPNKYNQQWLLSIKREEFVAEFINFSNGIAQNAIKIYDKLKATLKFGEIYEITNAEKSRCHDQMFFWTRKDLDDKDEKTHVQSLDHTHFLHIVSVILHSLKSEFSLVKTKEILLCLHKIEMNGLLFSKIEKKAFMQSVIMCSHSFKQVDIDALKQLGECTDKLYDEINNFNLKSIEPSTICSISWSDESDEHDLDNKNEHDDSKQQTIEELDIFTQWMCVFHAQYNRGTPFNLNTLKTFKSLITVYETNRKAIIKMKYDNYSTDLNAKTYLHVLKSLIAWSITLKCDNLRCEETLKLACFCDINTFQLFTYYIIIGIIELKANNDYSLLNKLSNIALSVAHIVDAFCDVLNDELKGQKYFNEYKLFIAEWINFEFYNFRCEYCGHINKTIMIDRVYQYSKTMDSCRICNKRQMSRTKNNHPQFDIRKTLKKKHQTIEKPYEAETCFSLYSLNEYLARCNVKQEHLKTVKEYLKNEEYDSDAVMQDISGKSNKQSNIYNVLEPNYYALFKKYLNYDRYPTYQEGVLIRYLVLRPKFFSLLKEICLNDVFPLSIEDWEIKIITEVRKEYENKSIYSNVTDKKFGIEESEPIGIHHLAAIFLFTDDRFQKYRGSFSRSYWLWSKKTHCNNFYHMGRYIFEAVQFYGTRFTNQIKETFYQGINRVVSFNYIAPVFNSPTLITENKNHARKFAGADGCSITIRPKYVGDIDNSKMLYAHLFNKSIRLLKGTKLQVKSIQIVRPPQDLSPIVLAMQYIEKVLLQTEFTVHFYNADDLYSPSNMKRAYSLIMNKIEHRTHLKPYAAHLFENWCFEREFVTFETFRLEMNYMDYKLKVFLFDEKRNKIDIQNVKRFLPNLKHYHDINGILRDVKTELKLAKIPNIENDNNKNINAVFGLLYNCQSHDIAYHIVNALADIHYKFANCKGVLREAFNMKLSKLDINIESFYSNSQYFNKQLISIGISPVIALSCITSIKKDSAVNTATKAPKFIELILNRLENQYGNHVSCDLFTQKKAFQKLYSSDLQKFQTIIEKKENITIENLYKVARNIKIFNEEIAKKLSRYLYMKMIDDKEKIVPWKCQACQFENCPLMVFSLWRYYNEGNKCGMCGDSRYLMSTIDKQIDQKSEKQKRFKKRTSMAFLKYNKYKSKILQPSSTLNLIEVAKNQELLNINQEEWEKIEDISECKLFKSVKHLSVCQLVHLLKNHFIVEIINNDKVKKWKKDILKQYTTHIVSYFEENKIDGNKFCAIKKKEFVSNLKNECKNNKMHVALLQLFKVMTQCDLTKINNIPVDNNAKQTHYIDLIKDCPALQKIRIVLQSFEDITNKLHSTDNLYPFEMNLYLSLFPDYSPVDFLNDIDHIIKHKLNHPQICELGEKCIHVQRAFRDRQSEQCKTLPLKKQFFNTNNQSDFVYISMLDRAHCLLKHSDEIITKMSQKIKKLLSEEITKIQYTPYNTGVYMQYHALNPLYQNLFDEIIRSQKLDITEEQFNSELEVSKLHLKTVSATDRACKTDAKYGIKINEQMHIEHVLCIKFYCNYTELCAKFRKSYRKVQIEDIDDDIIRRHVHDHYWFGRFLTTAIEFFGEIPKPNDHFYHGLDNKFVFTNFSAVYEIPTSTTLDITVAHSFCDVDGIVLRLSPKYTTEANNSRCLDVSGLSDFKAEKEKLFAGMTVLSITNIYNPSDNKWKGYSEYIASFLYFERIIEQTYQQKHHYNYGQLDQKKQREYLVPLLKHQMRKNGYSDSDSNMYNNKKIPLYICILFEFFCNNKRDYINLSCINEEIVLMDKLLQNILFESVELDDNNNLKNYRINNHNLRYIFPNLMEYNNHMGYWIYVKTQTPGKNSKLIK